MREKQGNGLMLGILSLSLLTVMAGAAVAPALGVVQAYFFDVNPLFVQMIVSVPAIFIVITNLGFTGLCRVFGVRHLVMLGLVLYTAGGCIAGCFSHIGLVLLARALVGIGVGIIMPLSTGLLAYYYPVEQQSRLMGYSSAMNQMGGVIATLLSGILAGISWRASFLVYLLGLVSIVLCLIFLPNDKIAAPEQQLKQGKQGSVLKDNWYFVAAMFLLMTTFFVYPTNFAMEVEADGVIPLKYVAVIMAVMDFIAFIGGLSFVYAKKVCKGKMKFLAPVLFLLGYVLLAAVGGWLGTLTGSVLIGFANGVGIPYIISTASKQAGKTAVTTVMPLISAALYLAQFICPMLISCVNKMIGGDIAHLPYWTAVALAALFCLCSAAISDNDS